MSKLQSIAGFLTQLRGTLPQHGYDISRIAIGLNPFGDNLRVCDDNGAYDFRVGLKGKVYMVSVGSPDRASETLCTHPKAVRFVDEINCTVQS